MSSQLNVIYIRNVDTETNKIVSDLMKRHNENVGTKTVISGLKSIPYLYSEISDLKKTITKLQSKIETTQNEKESIIDDLQSYFQLEKNLAVVRKKLEKAAV